MITLKNFLLSLMVLCLLSACTDKGKVIIKEQTKADSTAAAKADSIEAAEGKEAKEVQNVVKK